MYKLFIEKNVSSKDLLDRVLRQYKINDEIVYNEYGKPYLCGNKFYFNISHSYEYTVLVISDREVGVDIEKITFKERVIDRVCTLEEKKLIKNSIDFIVMWVKKESYVKYLGVGLSYDLVNVDTLKIKNFIIKRVEDYFISIYMGDV